MTDLVVEQREASASHAIALARPMLGTPMAGDPVIATRKRLDPLYVRRACQYAMALLQRDPQWAGDLSHLTAVCLTSATVLFCTKVGENLEVVASVALPRHVLDFNPAARPLRLSG